MSPFFVCALGALMRMCECTPFVGGKRVMGCFNPSLTQKNFGLKYITIFLCFIRPSSDQNFLFKKSNQADNAWF